MLRWNDVADITLFGMTVKMYREPFIAAELTKAPQVGLELDHYAYKHLKSELYMYRILDTNFERYIEERGDVSRIVEGVFIPLRQDQTKSIL
jgi:hypothetical protein